MRGLKVNWNGLLREWLRLVFNPRLQQLQESKMSHLLARLPSLVSISDPRQRKVNSRSGHKSHAEREAYTVVMEATL